MYNKLIFLFIFSIGEFLKVNENLKLSKKKIDKMLSQNNFERDEQNRVIVNMIVKDDKHVLSEFSNSQTPIIDNKVGDFIENATASVPASELLTLKITSDCISDEEKGDYGKGIKEYYKNKYALQQKELKHNYFIVLFLTVISVALLALSFLIKTNVNLEIWGEVVNIVAWFFLWEAVAIISFRTQAMRFKRNKYLSYLSMKIEYQTFEEAKTETKK